MITKEPTHADLEALKQIWTQYKDQLQPNRKSGMELLHYLQKKFVLTERFDEHAIRAISDNVTMNSHSAEKIPAEGKLIPRAFFLENAGAGTYLYQPENQDAPDLWDGKVSRIFVGVELTTGEFMVEGSTLLWDELYAFRGLDEQDLQNYVCVALYINCCNRIQQWKRKNGEDLR